MHQNNGRRSLNQNHSKRKHTELAWKPEVGKNHTERGEFYYNNGDYRRASL